MVDYCAYLRGFIGGFLIGHIRSHCILFDSHLGPCHIRTVAFFVLDVRITTLPKGSKCGGSNPRDRYGGWVRVPTRRLGYGAQPKVFAVQPDPINF